MVEAKRDIKFVREISPEGEVTGEAGNEHPRQRSDVIVRSLEGEMLVLDRRAGVVHQLNQTAAFVWERCDGRSTVAQIAHRLVEAFEIDLETAARDAAATVAQLRGLNLLEPLPEKLGLSATSLRRG